MSKLSTMVSMEYRMDVKAKSFWISTLLVPLLIAGFGVFISFLGSESDAMVMFSKSTSVTPDKDISSMQVMGMLCGIFLSMFVMMYGAQIFNKVKSEKCNRIVEVLVSCVSGRTVMLAKVISVALVGLTQILLWVILIVGIIIVTCFIIPPGSIDFTVLLRTDVLCGMLVALLYFIGGFVFYGALFAAAGALTDRNNENQGYLSLLMLLLMASFYIGIFATDAEGSALAEICFYLPFTSPTVGAVQSIGGLVSWWQTLLSILTLYGCSIIAMSMAGKIYTSAVLLKGKKFTPKDIITFLKAK